MAADEVSNRDIADIVGLHSNQVGLWRKRYGELGLAGLEDEERPGRRCVYDHDDVLLLVKTVTEEPPEGGDALDDGRPGRGHGGPRGAHLGLPVLPHL
jgi:transposase-like protein